MLEELHVSGLGVIEDSWLRFGSGLNVLTGETGAGKTMVTVALGLALGGRGSPGLVRAGHVSLAVEARFVGLAPLPELKDWTEDDELVVARTVSAEGRSTARIAGHLSPVSAVARIRERLVEFHGQHQTERLLMPAAQTEFLDRYGGTGHLEVLAAYREAYGRLRRVRQQLEALDRDAREREREKDLLAYQVREIESARITVGEAAAIVAEESRLRHAERLLELTGRGEQALTEEDGVVDRLRQAVEHGRAIAALDPSQEGLAERLGQLVAEADDVARDLRGYRERIDVNPRRLDEVNERVQLLRSLERKYGDGEAGVLAYLQEAAARLANLSGSEARREELAARVAEVDGLVQELAARLTAGRTEAAPALSTALTGELQELGMPGARLDVMLTPVPQPGPDGQERAEFAFCGGRGQPTQPLARVASGGELSRTMLACRSVMADLDDVPTLVFDEVDAGIGGRTAAAVGRRLAAVAQRRQVVVVTHLAQIAAAADRQFVVTKEAGTATVREVEGKERVAEVARMLSGSTGDVSLAHARELLAAREGAMVEGARRTVASR